MTPDIPRPTSPEGDKYQLPDENVMPIPNPELLQDELNQTQDPRPSTEQLEASQIQPRLSQEDIDNEHEQEQSQDPEPSNEQLEASQIQPSLSQEDIGNEHEYEQEQSQDPGPSNEQLEASQIQPRLSQEDIGLTQDQPKPLQDHLELSKNKPGFSQQDQLKISEDEPVSSQNQIAPSQDELKISQDELKISQDELKISQDELKISQDELKISQDQMGLCLDEPKLSEDKVLSGLNQDQPGTLQDKPVPSLDEPGLSQDQESSQNLPVQNVADSSQNELESSQNELNPSLDQPGPSQNCPSPSHRPSRSRERRGPKRSSAERDRSPLHILASRSRSFERSGQAGQARSPNIRNNSEPVTSSDCTRTVKQKITKRKGSPIDIYGNTRKDTIQKCSSSQVSSSSESNNRSGQVTIRREFTDASGNATPQLALRYSAANTSKMEIVKMWGAETQTPREFFLSTLPQTINIDQGNSSTSEGNSLIAHEEISNSQSVSLNTQSSSSKVEENSPNSGTGEYSGRVRSLSTSSSSSSDSSTTTSSSSSATSALFSEPEAVGEPRSGLSSPINLDSSSENGTIISEETSIQGDTSSLVESSSEERNIDSENSSDVIILSETESENNSPDNTPKDTENQKVNNTSILDENISASGTDTGKMVSGIENNAESANPDSEENSEVIININEDTSDVKENYVTTENLESGNNPENVYFVNMCVNIKEETPENKIVNLEDIELDKIYTLLVDKTTKKCKDLNSTEDKFVLVESRPEEINNRCENFVAEIVFSIDDDNESLNSEESNSGNIDFLFDEIDFENFFNETSEYDVHFAGKNGEIIIKLSDYSSDEESSSESEELRQEILRKISDLEKSNNEEVIEQQKTSSETDLNSSPSIQSTLISDEKNISSVEKSDQQIKSIEKSERSEEKETKVDSTKKTKKNKQNNDSDKELQVKNYNPKNNKSLNKISSDLKIEKPILKKTDSSKKIESRIESCGSNSKKKSSVSNKCTKTTLNSEKNKKRTEENSKNKTTSAKHENKKHEKNNLENIKRVRFSEETVEKKPVSSKKGKKKRSKSDNENRNKKNNTLRVEKKTMSFEEAIIPKFERKLLKKFEAESNAKKLASEKNTMNNKKMFVGHQKEKELFKKTIGNTKENKATSPKNKVIDAIDEEDSKMSKKRTKKPVQLTDVSKRVRVQSDQNSNSNVKNQGSPKRKENDNPEQATSGATIQPAGHLMSTPEQSDTSVANNREMEGPLSPEPVVQMPAFHVNYVSVDEEDRPTAPRQPQQPSASNPTPDQSVIRAPIRFPAPTNPNLCPRCGRSLFCCNICLAQRQIQAISRPNALIYPHDTPPQYLPPNGNYYLNFGHYLYYQPPC